MVILYKGSPATGGLNLLEGKDRIHLHQRQFCNRKAYANLLWWDTLGITRDV